MYHRYVVVPSSTAVAMARGAVKEGDASFTLGDLRSVADAHGGAVQVECS